MNILNIAWKEIKTDARDIGTLVFLIAFPIVMMLILGTALSGAFNNNVSVGDINVLYKATGNGPAIQSFQAFAKAMKKYDVHFDKASENVNGKAAVKDHQYDGYVEVSDKGIQVYENNRANIAGNVLEGMLSAYADRFNMISAVSQVKPDQTAAASTAPDDGNFIKETSLHSKREPGSMDYYAIAMTTMIVLYSSLSAAYMIKGERIRRTGDRLIAAPITKAEIFIGKLFGGILSAVLSVIIVILFSKFVFNAYWGHHLGIVILVLFTEILLAIGLGLGISFLTKTDGIQRVILMIIIQVASFFGGAYFPIDDVRGFGGWITKLSPITWQNNALNQVIYANNLTPAFQTAALNLAIAAVFLAIAMVFMKRREGI
ncbi:ABC transporter permease [Camelliibacillus cellulosilyticus]|uniref:ABC transporter permease n=1 Tax=Camelliibacillus cellulosilyticus TaxID=2174486 RepID=A0ABV9GV61_9BACL